MLELKEIKKNYPAGDGVVEALKGISLTFRKSEFVSILGPSGCGKTTMLNIIGGLDQYTSGDLVINGKSTRDFRSRDWDSYRNHTIGFVFQSYNLIPHQTVLQNVELALTLSGVSKSERRKRARAALEQVGLSNQLKKKPGEMSGGQMQRVAIARALVTNPDILLADEPTGALDTETSVQVMEILKRVSRDRLVIMVTHNPELAQRYSTRTIRMLDGHLIDDSMPLSAEEKEAGLLADKEKQETKEKLRKPSMSFATAFSLSLKNLFTKKGRTLLTAFAGSIGIIGIALITAVSQGTTNYINQVQEDTLSSYPLTLESQHTDLGALLETFIGAANSTQEHEKDAVYQKAVFYDLMNSLNDLEASQNDLAAFKKYLEARLADENDTSGLREAVSGVQYTYGQNLPVYTESVDGSIIRSDSQELLQGLIAEYWGMSASALSQSSAMSQMSVFSSSSTQGQLWQEMLPGKNGEIISDTLKQQYDVVYGQWPQKATEIVLVLDENNELGDMSLYALGLKSKEEINAIMQASLKGDDVPVDQKSWSYREICDMTFRVILPADCYTKDETNGLYTDLRESESGLKYLYDNALELTVSGIIRPSENAVSSMLSGSIGYTTLLTKMVAERSLASPALTEQMQKPDTDLLSGLPFRDSSSLTNKQKAEAFRDHAEKLSESEKAALYLKMKCLPSEQQKKEMTAAAIKDMTRSDMESVMAQILSSQMGMGEEQIQGYLASMSDEELTSLFSESAAKQAEEKYAASVAAELAPLPEAQRVSLLTAELEALDEENGARYYDALLSFSDSTYEENLEKLGYVNLEVPTAIHLYASAFANKDIIEDAIAEYNNGVEEISRITYTDYVGIMMSSVTTVINAVTYVLIAFVAISLIVSSIMIGVITLISVQERTKEIGILRALGASKHDVSSMFNAETVIIGFASGALGIGITYLLCLPINAVIHSLTNIATLSAHLPLGAAVILILISVVLTLISGLIPSRSAAKKDPVVALRTE